jgi:hypothetical protein
LVKGIKEEGWRKPFEGSLLWSTPSPKISIPIYVFDTWVIPMVLGQRKGWLLVSSTDTRLEKILKAPIRVDNKP